MLLGCQGFKTQNTSPSMIFLLFLRQVLLQNQLMVNVKVPMEVTCETYCTCNVIHSAKVC